MGEWDQFAGVPRRTLAFLADLRAHNDKAWFDANRARYDRDFVDVAKRLVTAVGDGLQTLDPTLNADPRVNGSIFRINRDVRFSKDKRPYKDHMDLWFWGAAGRHGGNSGCFFRLTPDRLIIGAGMHMMDKEGLARLRTAIAGPAGATLPDVVVGLRAAGYRVGGERYKRVPRGLDPEHPRADLLKHNALFAEHDGPHPPEIHTAALVGWCVGHFRAIAPLHEWLNANAAA